MKIIIEAKDVGDLKVKLFELAGAFGMEDQKQEKLDLKPKTEAKTEKKKVKVEEPPKSKEEKLIEKYQLDTPKAELTPRERVMEALKKLSSERGLEIAREVVYSFQVKKVSDLKDEQFEPFIEACNKALIPSEVKAQEV
ncbi:hypothetical protein E6Q11_02450 [Candidatus Dojkabacteria bacterium]|uniref:Uncharacterized protein n=1 Tax=Candidatus Dojkabacteria bacterium TaxID=2099670 RepID=A0A5C7J7X9_9BACT|nr:MAG: hypothetical protein E6Q11_02450 [Candidatus Dojkabacteria bacterium]